MSNLNVGRCAVCAGLVFNSLSPPAKMPTFYLEFGSENTTVCPLESVPRGLSLVWDLFVRNKGLLMQDIPVAY